jgi:integrase
MNLPPPPNRWTIGIANAERIDAISSFRLHRAASAVSRDVLLHAGSDPTKPMLQWDTACRALRDGAGLHGLRLHDLRHTVITQLAEMGVADHVLESISGHLSQRMLEHYSHIRIDPNSGA